MNRQFVPVVATSDLLLRAGWTCYRSYLRGKRGGSSNFHCISECKSHFLIVQLFPCTILILDCRWPRGYFWLWEACAHLELFKLIDVGVRLLFTLGISRVNSIQAGSAICMPRQWPAVVAARRFVQAHHVHGRASHGKMIDSEGGSLESSIGLALVLAISCIVISFLVTLGAL